MAGVWLKLARPEALSDTMFQEIIDVARLTTYNSNITVDTNHR